MSIQTKRAYEPASPDDGYRVLIGRLWPRGVSKADARIEDRAHGLAPSRELRRQADEVADLRQRADGGSVTLVYAARDSEHSNAAVLASMVSGGFPPA